MEWSRDLDDLLDDTYSGISTEEQYTLFFQRQGSICYKAPDEDEPWFDYLPLAPVSEEWLGYGGRYFI